jgi:hypothetical protein
VPVLGVSVPCAASVARVNSLGVFEDAGESADAAAQNPESVGWIGFTVIVVAIASLGGAILGGAAGTRYHREVGRAGLGR